MMNKQERNNYKTKFTDMYIYIYFNGIWINTVNYYLKLF